MMLRAASQRLLSISSCATRQQQARHFHPLAPGQRRNVLPYVIVRGKKSKKAAVVVEESADDDDEEDVIEDTPPSADVLSKEFLDAAKKNLDATVSSLSKQLARMRGSGPTPELFESVSVSAYGAPQPLSAVAQVSIVSNTMVEVTCFDPQLAPSVSESLTKLKGFSLNPVPAKGKQGALMIPFPRPSSEARQALAKAVAQAVEKSKVRARKVRQKYQDKMKSNSEDLPEDDVRKQAANIDKLNEKAQKAITKLGDDKKADIDANAESADF